MKKGWLVVISLVAAIALLGAVGCAAPEGEIRPTVTATTHVLEQVGYNSQQGGIWVSGQGRVSVTPDIAVLMLGVEAQADTVAEARGKAAEAMEAIITALQANGVGVAEEDIRTFHFSISQAWEWDRITGEPILAGFRVSNMVSATIRELDKVGLIIDAVAEAGGDLIRIHGVGFTVEDPTAYQEQAREKAFTDARTKAEQLAGLAGVTLGKATYITEGMGYIPPMPMPPHYPMAMVAEAGFVTPIMPGEQDIIIDVQVAFAIATQ